MLNEFHIPPNDAVYIGDNVEKDFKGPKELGMITIKVVRDGIYKNSVAPGKAFEPGYIINSLFELDNLLIKI